MAFGNIFGQGGCSLISRMIGQKNEDGVRRVSAFCFYAAMLSGLLIGAVMLLLRGQILALLGANEDVVSHAAAYYNWLAIGAPLIVLSFIHSNLLRAVGFSRESMTGSIGGAVINMLLDPILISMCRLGAAGAAAATVIGYVFTDIFYLAVTVRKCPQFSIRLLDIPLARTFVVQVFGIGIPAALTNLMQSFSIILINHALLSYGTDKIAAMGIVLKVTSIAMLILVGFAFGGQPLIGYLYGAGERERLSRLIAFCFRFNFVLALILTLPLFVAAPSLMGLFLNDTAIIEAGALMLRLQIISMPFVAIAQIIMILFQSTGKMLASLFLSVGRQGLLFVIVLSAAVHFAGYYGIIAAQAIADVWNVVIALILYSISLRRELRYNSVPSTQGTASNPIPLH